MTPAKVRDEEKIPAIGRVDILLRPEFQHKPGGQYGKRCCFKLGYGISVSSSLGNWSRNSLQLSLRPTHACCFCSFAYIRFFKDYSVNCDSSHPHIRRWQSACFQAKRRCSNVFVRRKVCVQDFWFGSFCSERLLEH